MLSPLLGHIVSMKSNAFSLWFMVTSCLPSLYKARLGNVAYRLLADVILPHFIIERPFSVTSLIYPFCKALVIQQIRGINYPIEDLIHSSYKLVLPYRQRVLIFACAMQRNWALKLSIHISCEGMSETLQSTIFNLGQLNNESTE